MVRGREVAWAFRSLDDVVVLRLECARMLYKDPLALVLIHGRETTIWREYEKI